jgi:signal transduction histidine kinase
MAGTVRRGGEVRTAIESAARAAAGERVSWVYRYILVTGTKPIVRQVPTLIATAVAVVLAMLLPPIGLSSPEIAWTGVAIIAVASALAGILSIVTVKSGVSLIVPSVSLIGIGFFLAGSEGAASVYTALVFLPVMWMAAAEGRRHIVLAFVICCIAMAIPYLTVMRLPVNTVEWALCLFTPVVVGLAALYVNELSRQAHVQVRLAQRSTAERTELLDEMTRTNQRIRDREAQLRTANALTSSVLGSVTEQAIIGTDLEGLIDVWNPGASALIGLAPREVEGRRHIIDFHVPEELAQRAAELGDEAEWAALDPGFMALVHPVQLGEADVRTWTYQKANGVRVAVEVAVTPRTNASGDTIGYIFVASDVSYALKVARLQDEFIGLVSHELRTPLSSIMGYLELLREENGASLGEDERRYLDVVERNAERLLHLVGDVLMTAQVESGAVPIDAARTRLWPLVAAAVESARPAATHAGIELITDLPADGDFKITGDNARLGQVFDNLLSNAIKFTPQGGAIAVRLSYTAEHARVSISDTGMGIPAGEIERLGSKFFRATTARRNAVPGTGLGLAIAKAIVHAHGGRLGVQSTEGHGTTFTVTLPPAGRGSHEQTRKPLREFHSGNAVPVIR